MKREALIKLCVIRLVYPKINLMIRFCKDQSKQTISLKKKWYLTSCQMKKWYLI